MFIYCLIVLPGSIIKPLYGLLLPSLFTPTYLLLVSVNTGSFSCCTIIFLIFVSHNVVQVKHLKSVADTTPRRIVPHVAPTKNVEQQANSTVATVTDGPISSSESVDNGNNLDSEGMQFYILVSLGVGCLWLNEMLLCLSNDPSIFMQPTVIPYI